jgi:hypothetical protein
MQRGPVGADARLAAQFDRVPGEDTWLATIVGYVDTLDLGFDDRQQTCGPLLHVCGVRPGLTKTRKSSVELLLALRTRVLPGPTAEA